MSPLVASAIGTGLGTVAEGGSLQEGLSAGLMGGVTGGLLKGIGGGGDILGGAGTEAATEAAKALPDVSTLEKLRGATGGTPVPDDAGIFSRLKTGLGNIPSSMGLTQGMVADPAAGTGAIAADAMVPSALSRGQAFMGQALPSLASGMVGDMYVPEDMPQLEEEESPYQYEGPYKPTEQRTMTGPADPFASAFMGEQDMIGGNVFPPGFNMRYGGLIKRLERGGMPKAQQQIEESAATLDRRAQDQRILDYQQSIMAAPTVDPRSPVPPQGAGPYQAPSLREIYDSQGKLLDDVLGPNPDAPLSGNYPNYQRLKEINRNYNPLVHGIHGVSALFGKGIAEAMEAVDESRARRKGKE